MTNVEARTSQVVPLAQMDYSVPFSTIVSLGIILFDMTSVFDANLIKSGRIVNHRALSQAGSGEVSLVFEISDGASPAIIHDDWRNDVAVASRCVCIEYRDHVVHEAVNQPSVLCENTGFQPWLILQKRAEWLWNLLEYLYVSFPSL